MMIRTLILALAIGGTGAAALSGCSGRPENSPAIRKKFAEVDQMQQKVEEMTRDMQTMADHVRRLNEENSELRAFLPDVDGESAGAVLTSLTERVEQLESGIASAGTTRQTSRDSDSAEPPARSAPEEQDLEDAPLAGSEDRAVADARSSSQQQRSSSPADTFREQTNTIAAQREQSRQQPSQQQQQQSAPRSPGAALEPSRSSSASSGSGSGQQSQTGSSGRGQYHTIEAGETLQSIAERFNVSQSDLLRANRLPQGARVARGQRLYIPPQ